MTLEVPCDSCFNKISTEKEGVRMQNGRYLCNRCIEDPKFLCAECHTLKSLDTEIGIITDSLTLCKKCIKSFVMHYLKRTLQEPEHTSLSTASKRKLDELFWKTG